MTAVTKLDLPEADYFALDAFSASGAKRLLPPGCPALFRHDRDHGRPDTAAFDFGHAAHAMVLGGRPIVVVEADSWRTKAAKTAADEARAAGQIPLLRKTFDQATTMHDALMDDRTAGNLFTRDGDSEVTVLWDDEATGVPCKARIDRLTSIRERVVAVDLKTTDADLDDASLARTVVKYGYDVQAAQYLDGLAAIGAEDPAFLFVFQQKTAPYLVRVIELSDDFLARGRARVEDARALYAKCVANDDWPGYSSDIDLIYPPRWA